MLDIFKRASAGILAVTGEDSFLRDGEPCKVNIEHGVEITGLDNLTVIRRAVATISQTMNPKVGDRLVHPDGTFRLDTIYANSGVNSRFILLPLES